MPLTTADIPENYHMWSLHSPEIYELFAKYLFSGQSWEVCCV